MLLRTAQMRYAGPDKLDVTVKSGDKVFAPTWDLVMGIKNRCLAEWEYTERYIELMRRSFQANKPRWKDVWAMESVVLTCYCPAGTFCHRYLLKEIFLNPVKYLYDPVSPTAREDGEFFSSLPYAVDGGEVELPKKAPKGASVTQPGLF